MHLQKKMIVVPRLGRLEEAPDDHQLEIARPLVTYNRVLLAYEIQELAVRVREINDWTPSFAPPRVGNPVVAYLTEFITREIATQSSIGLVFVGRASPLAECLLDACLRSRASLPCSKDTHAKSCGTHDLRRNALRCHYKRHSGARGTEDRAVPGLRRRFQLAGPVGPVDEVLRRGQAEAVRPHAEPVEVKPPLVADLQQRRSFHPLTRLHARARPGHRLAPRLARVAGRMELRREGIRQIGPGRGQADVLAAQFLELLVLADHHPAVVGGVRCTPSSNAIIASIVLTPGEKNTCASVKLWKSDVREMNVRW